MLSLPRMIADLKGSAAGWRPDSLASLSGIDVADLNRFMALRTAALQESLASEHSIRSLSAFARQLLHAAPLFEGYESEMNFEFRWSSAFSTAKRVTSSSVFFELAAVLWNLAADHSVVGILSDRKTVDGLRAGCRAFSFAAGALTVLRERVAPRVRGVTVPNLSDSGLQFAINLMLAQAQALFYLKAAMDVEGGSSTVTTGIVAKIAAQASLFYSRALVFLRQEPMASTIDASWVISVQYELKCYNAYAESYQAMAAKELALKTAKGYGEEVARLQKSIRLLRELLDSSKTFDKGLAALKLEPERMLKVLEARLVTAVKENNLIYLDPVPGESALSPVDGVVMAKAAADPLEFAVDPLLFAGVVSKEVRELAADLRNRLMDLSASVSAEANQAANAASALLSDMGLPGSLESVKAEGALPDSLWARVERVQAAGCMDDLRRRQADVSAKAERAGVSIEQLQRAMERERADDRAFVAQHPMAASSAGALDNIRATFLSLRDSYATARMADAALADVLESPEFKRAMELLSKDRSELNASLPSAVGSLTKVGTMALEQTLADLDRSLQERLRLKKQLEAQVNDDVVSEVQRRVSAGEELRKIETELLGRYSDMGRRVRELVAQQPQLLDAIVNNHQRFVEARSQDPQSALLDNAIAAIERSISQFTTVQSQMSDGLTFYTNLQARLSSLAQSLDDLCYAQHMMRRETEDQETSQRSRLEQERADAAFAQRLQDELKVSNSAEETASNSGRMNDPPQFSSNTAASAPKFSYPTFGGAPSVPPNAASEGRTYTYQHTTPVSQDSSLKPNESSETNAKLARLVEMGFRREDAVEQLRRYNNDERSALNALLGM